jgi:hypothetical protein
MEAAPDLVTFVGNRTECALLMMTRRWGYDFKQARGHGAGAFELERFLPRQGKEGFFCCSCRNPSWCLAGSSVTDDGCLSDVSF